MRKHNRDQSADEEDAAARRAAEPKVGPCVYKNVSKHTFRRIYYRAIEGVTSTISTEWSRVV
jgi:hypothetical protein